MTSLPEMCEIIDDFVSDGASLKMDGSYKFWKMLNKDATTAQLYTECLIYKYIALSYGLGHRPLFSTMSQIKNISAPGSPQSKSDLTGKSPASSPRGSLTSSGKSKRGSGNYEQSVPEGKITPKKKFQISRRKSEDSKKLKKENESADFRRKSKSVSKTNSSSESSETKEKRDSSQESDLDNVLLSLTYMAKMCDLTQWDFSKLREVFLTWTKARGWEQNAGDYEYSVMKKFSMSPGTRTNSEEQIVKNINEILSSVDNSPGELFVTQNKTVGESIKYWEIRHKILTRPEEATSVIKCLALVAKKVLEDGDEEKILPLLHILSETIIMSPHTPLELLKECYSTFEMFYVWPSYVAQPVKDVLDMIQLEMKCPGHFYRMMFFQDNDLELCKKLEAKMPSSETHVFIDEDIPDCAAFSEAFSKLRESRAAASKLADDIGMFRFVIKHIFESVYGSDCCDLSTLEQALQSTPSEMVSDICYEAMSIMEKASTMHTHGEAQDFLREELEIFSEKLIDFLEVEDRPGELDSSEMEKPNVKPPGHRRVSVLYETCRIRDPNSPSRSSFVSGQRATPSPRRHNSYLHKQGSTLEKTRGAKKIQTIASVLAKETPAELLGSKVSLYTFDHNDISETINELVRNSAKDYVQEKKRSLRRSVSRKRGSTHFDEQDAYRDSGVIDDDDPGGEHKEIATGVQNLLIEETEEETKASPVLDSTEKSVLSATSSIDSDASFTRLVEAEDSDSFWKEFSEKGFGGDDDGELVELLKAMSFDQRKSFMLETELKRRKSSSSEPTKNDITNPMTPPFSPTIVVDSIDSTPPDNKVESNISVKSTPPYENIIPHKRLEKNDSKKYSRLSRFVRSKRKASKKGINVGDNDNLSSEESLSSLSSTPSSTSTSDELSDTQSIQSLRIRTASDPVFGGKKRGKWSRGTLPASSPMVSKKKRNRLSVDVTPRSSFSLSVRSLPSKDRVSVIGGEIFAEGRQVSPLPEDDQPNEDDKEVEQQDADTQYIYSPTKNEVICMSRNKPASPRKARFLLGEEVDDDEEARRRIDSGIGADNMHDTMRRRTNSSLQNAKVQEDLGIGGVKTAMKEALRSSRRNRLSVSDALEDRTIHKKVLKLVFVGNDKTVGHVARAYYNLRKQQMTRAPLFQHIDLRLYFIPVASYQPAIGNNVLSETCPIIHDIKVGEMLATYDSWFHTVVTLSVSNLMRVFPKISPSYDPPNEVENSETINTEKQSSAMQKLQAPQEIITSALLSYCRFAVSKTEVNMYKVTLETSTGDILSDVFCCQLKIGHEAYTTAVKAGRFGKLGKLVDLSNDSGPPPAYTKIEYSKWSIDGQLIYTGKLDDTFYHTVCVTPMPLCKEHYKGRDVLQLLVIDNEKREKTAKRVSNNKLTAMEEAEITGNVLDIGNMKMEVVRPTQGTFALTLDNSKIYTSIKSIEIVPCLAPEMEMAQSKRRSVSRHLREYQLMKLPIRTFWPASQ